MINLSYNQKGRLDFEDPWLQITLSEDGVLEFATTYCPVTEIVVDFTSQIATSDKWMNRIVQDFCDLEEAKAAQFGNRIVG